MSLAQAVHKVLSEITGKSWWLADNYPESFMMRWIFSPRSKNWFNFLHKLVVGFLRREFKCINSVKGHRLWEGLRVSWKCDDFSGREWPPMVWQFRSLETFCCRKAHLWNSNDENLISYLDFLAHDTIKGSGNQCIYIFRLQGSLGIKKPGN